MNCGLEAEAPPNADEKPNFAATDSMLEDQALFNRVTDGCAPNVIVHIAAQAGGRYCLEKPRAYLDSNVISAFKVMPEGDSLPPVAPLKVVNIGNSDKVRLLDLVDVIEECLGQKPEQNYMVMKTGDWIARVLELYREYSGK